MLVKLEKFEWVRQFYQASKDDHVRIDQGFTSRCLNAPDTDECFGLKIDGHTVSFSSVRFTTRPRKNAYGRYADWHVAYTAPQLRRRHYATDLWNEIRLLAIAAGHDRVKSIAKGKLGFYLHRSLGHQFWGWDKGGRGLVVDSPLIEKAYPDGVPVEARCAINAHLLDDAELLSAEQLLL